jgi:8-oxo-dGTP pyrophosphatase MutT (NUDIX family)
MAEDTEQSVSRASGTRPPIVDARAVPVIGRDVHLPAICAPALRAQALRERFASAHALVWQPEIQGDGRTFTGRQPAAASVLVPLVERGGELSVLLTQRTDQLRDHAGQVSFPGGRAEAYDVDAASTALREAHEEIGLAPSQAEVIGCLPVYTTVTHYVVTPVVALVRAPLHLKLDVHEVADAFEVPLGYLMNPANHQRHRFVWEGGERQFLSMPWRGAGCMGEDHDYFIWGATAAMLRNLYSFLRSD